MRNFVLAVLVLSLMVIQGCKDRTETAGDREVSEGGKPVAQTQEQAVTTEAPGAKEEENIQEVFITIKEGQFEPAAFELKKNVKVRFRIKSLDVRHSFVIPSLRVNAEINPGEEVIVEVVPDTGEPFVHFHCGVHGNFLEKGTMTMK